LKIPADEFHAAAEQLADLATTYGERILALRSMSPVQSPRQR
jgi:hypothetical protein